MKKAFILGTVCWILTFVVLVFVSTYFETWIPVYVGLGLLVLDVTATYFVRIRPNQKWLRERAQGCYRYDDESAD